MLAIHARDRSIMGFPVGRVLPAVQTRMVGPVIFLDHMGPAPRTLDIAPHPHIALSTVTYLFEGAAMHRDSVGSAQVIRPGEINWMTAGRGIAHSERAPDENVASIHGIQLWVALPEQHEDTDPAFAHHDAPSLPAVDVDGVSVNLLAGSAFGAVSPVKTHSPLFYVDAQMPAGSSLRLPPEHEERGAYLVHGSISANGQAVEERTMAVFLDGEDGVLRAERDSRVMLLGGAPLGRRYIWWNFVGSRKEQILDAANAWREGRFHVIPGDEHERIPLPDGPMLIG